MIEVRMGENYRIDAGGRDGRILPITLSPFLGALEHAAINERLKAGFTANIRTGIDQMFRAGNSASCAKKSNVGQEASTFLRLDFRL